MLPKYLPLVLSCLFTFMATNLKSSESFIVVAYNVENLFDLDGVSRYEDYEKKLYGEKELNNKLDSIIRILKEIGGESGPDIVLLQEIEVDQTPENFPSATEILINRLKKENLGPYQHALGYDPKIPPQYLPSIHCLTLSKFPIVDQVLHPIPRARPILETTLSINGSSFVLFNNHWKSGASSEAMEMLRLQSAQVLRQRIDEIKDMNEEVDFLVGGDLNSHYNQSTVYAEFLEKTGINDVLLSKNLEPTGVNSTDNLYNLWHELPAEQRRSDAWRGKWGTLMHLILPDSLYDQKGISYVSDSFAVAKYDGLNSIRGSGLPFKWSNDLDGFGASDHFPIYAKFSTEKTISNNGRTFAMVENLLQEVDYSQARKKILPWEPKFLSPAYYGNLFRFSGVIAPTRPLALVTKGHRLGLYSFKENVRKKLFNLRKDSRFSGIGHLSRYRGQWQFIIEEENWIN